MRLVYTLLVLLVLVSLGCGTNPLGYPQNRSGVMDLRDGDYYGAVDNFDRALANDSGYAYALNNQGMASLKTGNYPRALDNLEASVTVKARYAHARNNLGVMYQNAGDDESAELFYRQAIRIRSEYEEPYFNMARAYYARQEYDLALLYVEKALELNYVRQAYNIALTEMGKAVELTGRNREGEWEGAEVLRSMILEQLGERPLMPPDGKPDPGEPLPIEFAASKPGFPLLEPGILGK